MNDDELRNRLAQLDPQADTPVDPLTSPRAQDLLERTMSNDTTELAETQSPRRKGLLMALAAGTAAAGIVAAVALTSGGTDPAPAAQGKKTTLTLKLPDTGGGTIINSCMMFDVAILKGFPVAFAGTATSVADDVVTLDVTKWYQGGSAQVVTLTSPAANTSVSLDSVAFATGKSYLVTANEGTVTSCGFSGEDTPSLRKSFDEAFS